MEIGGGNSIGLLDYWTMSIGNGRIASAIRRLGFAKSNSQFFWRNSTIVFFSAIAVRLFEEQHHSLMGLIAPNAAKKL